MLIVVNLLWAVAPVVVGCVLALLTRRRDPPRSTYAPIGFDAFALNEIATVLWSVSLPTHGSIERSRTR